MADDGGIGNNLDGRTVDEDVIVVLTQVIEHGLELGGVEQFGGVGRNFTNWKDVQLGPRRGRFMVQG